MFIFLHVEAERCNQYLGMYDGSIMDVQLSASSSRAGNRPSEARPHGVGWCSKSSDSEPYLQVSQILKKIYTVSYQLLQVNVACCKCLNI